MYWSTLVRPKRKMKEHRIKKNSNLELLALSELNKTYFEGFFLNEYFTIFSVCGFHVDIFIQ